MATTVVPLLIATFLTPPSLRECQRRKRWRRGWQNRPGAQRLDVPRGEVDERTRNRVRVCVVMHKVKAERLREGAESGF